MNKAEIGHIIYEQLLEHKEVLKQQFLNSKKDIGYFYIDNLLPKNLALEIFEKFPSTEETVKRKSLKEYKFTAFQMNQYNSLLEEVIYAFQDDKVIKLVAEICDLKNIYGDEFLYAGGLSLMKKDNFLNPHLDNSHDKDRSRWRVLSKFNRLVVMTTHQKSWHSVSKVAKDATRCCVSNYYFSDEPILESDSFHVTTFRGRSSEKVKDVILQVDNNLRSGLRKIFKKGVRENPHQYKK